MLRMPRFSVETPQTVDEAVQALQTPGARVVAGGTDLLPNIKHRLEQPPVPGSRSRGRDLSSVSVDEEAGVLRIGARVTLTAVSEHPLVRQHSPSLAYAAGIRRVARLPVPVTADMRMPTPRKDLPARSSGLPGTPVSVTTWWWSGTASGAS